MGMFDWVDCDYSLPDGGPTDPEFQTKTFDDPYLRHYRITPEGRLLKRDQWSMTEWEEGGDPKGPATWTDTNHHGVLNFYDSDETTDEWFEYDAKFTDGQLVSIERREA